MDEQTQEQMLALGKISWLWANSTLHRDWQVSTQARFVMPAVKFNQYAIVEADGLPVAYCSWAMIDQETEEKYLLDPSKFSAEAWNCGDRLWFVDWISPFNPRYTWLLRRNMADRFPKKVARALRVKRGLDRARVAVFAGKDLTREESHSFRQQYFADALTSLQNNPNEDERFEIVRKFDA